MRLDAIIEAPWRRSGRAIAAVRFLLASMFLTSLWIDPTQPTRRADLADLGFSGYLVFSLAMMAIAWTSWRLDTLLALPALLLDGAVFLAGLYFTESANSTFASPYVASFVFLVVCTLLRWGQRRAMVTVAVLVVCYLIDARILLALGIDLDMLRMLRRLVYMMLIALVFVWITPGGGAVALSGFTPPADVRSTALLLRLALDYAMTVTGARGGAIAWGETDGPPCELIMRRDGAMTGTRLGIEAADLFDTPVSSSIAVLWSPRTGRALRMTEYGAPMISRMEHSGLLADCARGQDMILVPLRASSVEAILLLWDIAGICDGDLQLACRARADIEGALDRNHILVLQEREMVAQMRGSVARDLHDGVAQSLAGALLRLEGLRNALRSGRDPFGNLDDAKAALRAEQANVRDMIDRLNDDAGLQPRGDAASELRQWIDTAAAVWCVGASLECDGAPVKLRRAMAFELRQLLREAIANAARHGHCRQVRISIERGPRDSLSLTIEDDGRGFAEGRVPRSIAERVSALDGEFATGPAALGGACLVMTIPKAIEQ